MSGAERHPECNAIAARYQERRQRYDPLEPWVLLTRQELERAVARVLPMICTGGAGATRLLEVGCGTGKNLLMFLNLGFAPQHLVGNELLEDRATEARRRLPAEVQVELGDAAMLSPHLGQFDVVFQSLVFSSILDQSFQAHLARRMWDMVRPGGGVLWYDFAFNNPSNPNVKGVPLRRVRELFPSAEMTSWNVTLAPPVSRRVSGLFAGAYNFFNALPFLRTHRLCWLAKVQ